MSSNQTVFHLKTQTIFPQMIVPSLNTPWVRQIQFTSLDDFLQNNIYNEENLVLMEQRS